jgi:hypothetical protein
MWLLFMNSVLRRFIRGKLSRRLERVAKRGNGNAKTTTADQDKDDDEKGRKHHKDTHKRANSRTTDKTKEDKRAQYMYIYFREKC